MFLLLGPMPTFHGGFTYGPSFAYTPNGSSSLLQNRLNDLTRLGFSLTDTTTNTDFPPQSLDYPSLGNFRLLFYLTLRGPDGDLHYLSGYFLCP